MQTTTIRISHESHEKLKDLASETGRSMQELLAEAIEMYRRHRMIEETNAFYNALRSDPEEWEKEEEEQALLDKTLADGLEDA